MWVEEFDGEGVLGPRLDVDEEALGVGGLALFGGMVAGKCQVAVGDVGGRDSGVWFPDGGEVVG